jgi:hypothetical protein
MMMTCSASVLFAVGVTEVAARKILGLDPEKK